METKTTYSIITLESVVDRLSQAIGEIEARNPICTERAGFISDQEYLAALEEFDFYSGLCEARQIVERMVSEALGPAESGFGRAESPSGRSEGQALA